MASILSPFAAASAAAVILAAAGLLHLYWAAGGSAGKAAAIPSVGGKPVLRPTALGTAAVGAALLAVAAFLLLLLGGWRAEPTPIIRLGGLGLTFLFALRAIGEFRYVGFFKRVHGSRFASLDTYVYCPICVLLALLIGRATVG